MRGVRQDFVRAGLAALAMVGALWGTGAQAQSSAPVALPAGWDATASCAGLLPSRNFSKMMERLAHIPQAPTTIVSAEVLPAERGLPENCRVEGYIAPTIGFVMRLPTTAWNGKLLMGGCGGPCGNIPTEVVDPALARGYAVIATDMGHKGKGWVFGYNNLQGLIDFGSRSTHLTAVVGKELIDAYYTRRAAKAYFLGCSTGGRQAMVEAQRFPEDFDGIIGGAPPYDQVGDTPLFLSWGARANIDADGKPILDAVKLPMIHKAVMEACQSKSDAVIGLLQDPLACKWDPGAILCKAGADPASCLSPAEADVIRKIYTGATNAKGRKLYFGMPRGSELGWAPAFVNTGGKPGDYLSGFAGAGNSMVTYGAFFYSPGPKYRESDFDYDADPQHLGVMEALYDARNHDLRAFKAAGGKFILYHGWNDNQIPAEASIDYYETATRVMGGPANTRDFFRAFMLPGVGHCIYGPGGGEVDWLTALENWVEKGQAPEQVIAYRPKVEPYPIIRLPTRENLFVMPRHPMPPGSWISTRPVYPYPALAKWTGKGDPKDASTWVKADR